MAAVAGSVSARGYAGMTVEDVISLAGVSRRTFYDHFKSKEDAFLVAYDGVCVQLYELVLGAYTRAPNDFERLRDSIDTFLRFLATDAAGPTAIERRDHLMRDFAAMFEAAGRGLSEDDIPPPLTAEAIVGGIYEVVYKRVLRGATASLPELVPELLYFGVVPYMGRDAAKARFVSTRAGRDGTAR
jgi:AcrR family transcriptional regulator